MGINTDNTIIDIKPIIGDVLKNLDDKLLGITVSFLVNFIISYKGCIIEYPDLFLNDDINFLLIPSINNPIIMLNKNPGNISI